MHGDAESNGKEDGMENEVLYGDLGSCGKSLTRQQSGARLFLQKLSSKTSGLIVNIIVQAFRSRLLLYRLRVVSMSARLAREVRVM